MTTVETDVGVGAVTPTGVPILHRGLTAGLRWLYRTVQADSALVERRGARLTLGGRVLRFIPISASGTPLIVVDVADVRWGLGGAPPLNTLGPEELPALVAELDQLEIPTTATGYHGVTGYGHTQRHCSPIANSCRAPLRQRMPLPPQPCVRSTPTRRRASLRVAHPRTPRRDLARPCQRTDHKRRDVSRYHIRHHL